QIRDGAKLYRDILYFYPPLTPYLLAAITAVIGNDLTSYQVIGTVIALLTAAVIYAFGRMAGSTHAAGAATLLFVSGSIYSISGRTMNYLIPYAYASTLAMLFFLGGAALLFRHVAARRSALSMAGALAMFALASWTKIEYAAFSTVLLLVVVIVFSIRLWWIAAWAVIGGVTLSLVHVYFSDAVPERHWLWENVLALSLLRGEPARHFYRQVSGFDVPGPNLVMIAAGIGVAALLALLVWTADRRRQPVVTGLIAVAMAVTGFYGGLAFIRGWALLQLVLLPVVVRRRDPLLIVVLASLCASSRVFLRLMPHWYGFVYAIPTLILIAIVVFEWLPARGVYSRRAALLCVIPIAVVSAKLIATETALLAAARFPVETARGTFYDANPYRAVVLNAFFAELEKRQPRSLVVVPEGLALNYLTQIPTPLSFYTFTPAEAADPEIEQRIVRELETTPPEMIAVVTRTVSDFGYRGFGIDYNRDMAAHIGRHYRLEREWRLPGFELILLRRAAVLSSPP
ncbi:MAG TPA: hypothetical protein VM779_13800, partial [Thermoanaerobaculia bacterium]|nr:hypothetical protein [Thermoanaerobaculia bacterium]